MAIANLWARTLRALVVVLCVSQAGAALSAAEQRYDYDATGRLVRAVGNGQSTDYVYDPAGNLLQVTGGVAASPVIATVTPSPIRRGQTVTVTLTGSGLSFASVTPPSVHFSVSGQKVQPSSIEFVLAVATDAPLGAQAFTVANAAGSAVANIGIDPQLPVLSVAPQPLAIPPDNVPRPFNLTLSNADSVPHTLNFAMSPPSLAAIAPTSVVVNPGTTSLQPTIAGKVGGTGTLTISSPTLATIQVPVFVTAEFSGINTSHAANVGVVKEAPPAPPPTQNALLRGLSDLSVVVGGHLLRVSPDAVVRGAGPVTLTLFGKGLEQVQNASIQPSAGITLSGYTAAPDGLSATLTIDVAANAAPTLRQLVLTDSGGKPLPTVRADADRIQIATGVPAVDSIQPLFGVPGSTVAMVLRGRNLELVKSIDFSPGTGIQVDSSPVVNGDGTALSFNIRISSIAPTGAHVVRVTTAGGSSDATKSVANTFTVVTEITNSVTPIAAPILGVVKETAPGQNQQLVLLGSPLVGITRGPVITQLVPPSGIIGSSFTMTLQGQELNGLSSVAFNPSTGISAGAVTVAPDGKSATVDIAIDAAAPKTLRTVKAMAGGVEIPFSSADGNQFLVTAPLPRIDSVEPINLQRGTGPLQLTIRGVNFQDASEVKILPAADVTVSQPPVVNANGTTVTVNITIGSGAATGPRLVEVVTPAGSTGQVLSLANTLNIVNTLGSAVTPIAAPSVGVVKEVSGPPPTEQYLVAGAQLGVVVEQTAPPPSTQSGTFLAPHVGVTVGAFAQAIQATPLRPGIDGVLTVTGMGLETVTSVAVSPSGGVTMGTPTIQPDGTSMTIPLTVAAGAVAGPRELVLTAGTARLPFSTAQADRFVIDTGAPRIDSITPILARQGDTVTLLIRGGHLKYATQVLALPGTGLIVSSTPVPNADGTELTVGLRVDPATPLGGQVIQVVAPGGTTTGNAEPANTFTVYPP